MSTGLLIAFMLISPGFCLAYAVRAFSRYDIKIDTQNNTSQLMLLIIISACVQTVTIPAYVYAAQYYFDLYPADILFTLEKYLAEEKTLPFNYSHWFGVVAYIPFSYLINGLLGYILINLVEKEWLATRFLHGAMYPIISGKNRPIIFCSVLTKTQHENSILMYRGRLQEVSYVSKHTIEYLSLASPQKFLMEIDTKKRKVLTGSKSRVSYFSTDSLPERLTLQGSDIDNVLFTKYFPIGNETDWKFGIALLMIPAIILLLYPPLWPMLRDAAYLFLEQVHRAIVDLCPMRK